MKCSSKITINQAKIRELSKAAVTSLEQTANELHTEVVQAQVVPRHVGILQGEAFFADYSESSNGRVSLVHSTPYARRLYFHPEYNFNQTGWDEKVYGKRGRYKKDGSEYKGRTVHHEGNVNAKGKWFEDWEPGGSKEDFAPKTFKEFYRRNAGL